MPRLLRVLGRRLLWLPISIFVVGTFAFGLIELMPGDPVLVIAGDHASDERIALIRNELGLDQPLATRYVEFWKNAAVGDLGTSLFTGRSVSGEILRFLPNTVELVAVALIIAATVGLSLGTVGAYFKQRPPDRMIRAVVAIFQSIPDFLFGLLLILVVFFWWGLAPAPVGRLGIAAQMPEGGTGFLLFDSVVSGNWTTVGNLLKHMALPSLALGVVWSAAFAKISRVTMAASLASSQVAFARACGLPERQVLRYAFLTARTPILTYGAILLGGLLGGAAIIETIFSWQGLGQWALVSILNLDVPAIRGFILVSGVIAILVYLVLDLLILILDPRVSYG